VTYLTQKSVLVALDFKSSGVDYLTTIFLNVIVIGGESFESYDKIAREGGDEGVYQTFPLDFSLLAEIVLKHVFDVNMVLHFVENASFRKFQLDYAESLAFNFAGNCLVFG